MERLYGFSAENFEEVLGLTSVIDEIKGWWQAYSRSAAHLLGSLRQSARANSGEAIRDNLRIGAPVLGRRGNWQELEQQNSAEAVSSCLTLLELVFENWQEVSLNGELILDLHRRISEGPGGRIYRTRPHRGAARDRRSLEAIALDPVSPDRIADEVKALTDRTAEELHQRSRHPLLLIASFLLEFLAIQPFSQGNHRVSRILANLLLMQSGYSYMPYVSLERAIADRRPYYDIALRNAMLSRKMSQPDVSPWVTEFLLVLRNQAVQLRTAAERHVHVDLLSENQMRAMGLFALHREITVRLVAMELQLSRDTAKQVLSRLRTLGLVQRLGSGRAVRYGQAP